MHILQTDAVKHKAPHMPIVVHEYLMSFTVLSANTKCRAVPIVADHADFVAGPQLQASCATRDVMTSGKGMQACLPGNTCNDVNTA